MKTAEEDSERTVQTKLTAGAAKDVYEQGADRVAGQVMTMPDAAAQRPNRTGLPDGLKSGVESLSGISLDNVNVHYNSSQPAQLNALAYTQGSDIHVAPGQEQHLPHEAWHVVQQAQGRVQPTMQMQDGVPVNDDEGLEQEADVMGGKARAVDIQRGVQKARPDQIRSELAVQRLQVQPLPQQTAADQAVGQVPQREVRVGPPGMAVITYQPPAGAAALLGALPMAGMPGWVLAWITPHITPLSTSRRCTSLTPCRTYSTGSSCELASGLLVFAANPAIPPSRRRTADGRSRSIIRGSRRSA